MTRSTRQRPFSPVALDRSDRILTPLETVDVPAHAWAYLRRAGPIAWDPDVLARSRVEPDLCRILHVVAQLEADTAISARQGRSLGVDRTSDVAAFLPSWEQEEAEHARALRFLLSHQSYAPARPAPASLALRRRAVARLPTGVLRRAPQPPLVYLVLGAAAEYVTIVVYSELARAAADPAVAQLLRDIARQEGRHFAFFIAASRVRARTISAMNARISRRVLKAVWEPPGVPSLGLSAWQTVFDPLLRNDGIRARVARMDRVLDSISHFAGLDLMHDFLQKHTDPRELDRLTWVGAWPPRVAASGRSSSGRSRCREP
jgi:hypothetical protein